MENKSDSQTLPVLPLRDIVVFPHMVVPLFVGRDKSVKALEEVMGKNKKIMLITQKSASTDDPKKDDLFELGTIAKQIDERITIIMPSNSLNLVLCIWPSNHYIPYYPERFKRSKYTSTIFPSLSFKEVKEDWLRISSIT